MLDVERVIPHPAKPLVPYPGVSWCLGTRRYTVAMTDPVEDTQSEVSLETERPERVIVRPDSDSRLEALHAQYEDCKQAEIEAKRKFKELKAAIAAELETMYPGDDRPSHAYVVPQSIYGPELTVYYKSQWYLPDAPIREMFPEIWDGFKREKKFTEVREAQHGRPRRRM